MDADRIYIYEACDKAIQNMDRDNLKAFGKLKMAKWDEIRILQTVTAVYRRSVRNAKRRYYEVASEAYILGLMMCGMGSKKAHAKADEAIDSDWVEEILEQTDFLTLYRFNTEWQRKAVRLAEALEQSPDRNYEIDKALKQWARQVGQYAINVTDYALIQAFEDAGVKWAKWLSKHDNKVCGECHALDGQVFRISEIPRKPHWNCRCTWIPVSRNTDGD